jgi:hypothetical protein
MEKRCIKKHFFELSHEIVQLNGEVIHRETAVMGTNDMGGSTLMSMIKTSIRFRSRSWRGGQAKV